MIDDCNTVGVKNISRLAGTHDQPEWSSGSGFLPSSRALQQLLTVVCGQFWLHILATLSQKREKRPGTCENENHHHPAWCAFFPPHVSKLTRQSDALPVRLFCCLPLSGGFGEVRAIIEFNEHRNR